MPAGSIVDTDRRKAGEVVIAVAGVPNAVETAKDDVGGEGITSAESSVGKSGGAVKLTGSGVVDRDLGSDQGSRGRDDDCLKEHFDFVRDENLSFGCFGD